MNRENVMEVMNNIYTSGEAAEYLNISMQRLNQLVHDHKISPVKVSKSVMLFLKSDLEQRKIVNYSNKNTETNSIMFDINIPYVRDAILYFTIQKFFNGNDKKTTKFIEQISEVHGFDYRAGLKTNIPLLSKILKVNEKLFYNEYLLVKESFLTLDETVVLVKKGDENYSKLLASVDEAPPYLFLKGDIHLLNEKSVCVVGSRNASNDSMKKTERIVQSLIKRNLVVNAGLAKGIDTATHSAALQYGGKTIAVIGTPINQYYPKENKNLQIEIEKKGLVVSQFPPCSPINRWNFPIRNATMSGISLATIIMEAGETSGALKQADYALKQGRGVLIPYSALENQAIKWPRKYVEKGSHSFKTLKEALEILNHIDLLKGLFNSDDFEEVTNVEMD